MMESTTRFSRRLAVAATHAVVCFAVLLSSGCGQRENIPAAVSNLETSAATPGSSDISGAGTVAVGTPALGTLHEQGIAALEEGDVAKADRLAVAAMAANPDDPQVIFLKAFVRAEQSRFAEAIKMLDDLAEDAPMSRLPVLGLTAEWMVLQGRWLDAEERCFKILEEVPDAVPARRLLVQLYTRQGRRLDAASQLRQLCRLGNIEEPELYSLLKTFYSFSYDADEPEFEPINELGVAHYQISAGDWDKASATLGGLSNKNAAESGLYGRVLAHQKEFDQLGEWAASVPEAAKVSADYWFALGVHHAHQGDHVAAIKNFSVAVVLDQTDTRAYSMMSRSLEAIHAGSHAEEAAKRASLIERTQSIADEIAAAPQRDLKKMVELVDLLDELQRPFEALSWRVVLLIYGGSTVSQLQSKQLLAEINQNRMLYLQSNVPVPSRVFVLCGVNQKVLQGSGASGQSTDSGSTDSDSTDSGE